MPTNYPASQDNGTTLPNPGSGNFTDAPDHAGLHSNENDAIKALEAKVGTGASTAASGKLLRGTGAGTSAWDKDAPAGTIVGTSDSQTLTNKTISTGSTIGSAVDVTEVLKKVYPVGCVYTTIIATNPNTVFGFGTWVAFGTGRTLVGLDSGQTEFDTVEETGGEKTHTLTTAEMPAHTHGYANDRGGVTYAGGANNAKDSSLGTTGSTTGSTGGGGAHNNLQPYIVVYFWKRTA